MGAVPAACRADHRPLGELVVETALPYWAHSNGRPDIRVPSERHTQVTHILYVPKLFATIWISRCRRTRRLP